MTAEPLPLPLQPQEGIVSSFDGTLIGYDLYGRPDSKVLVLVVPGFWRHRRHPAMPRLAAFLTSLGYRVAIVDVRGHGQSGGVFGFNLHEHRDVAAVAATLLSDLPIESLVLLGFSIGGAIAISTAARHELPIRGIVLISPVADLSRVTPRVSLFSLHRHIALGQAFSRPRFDWRLAKRERIAAIDDISGVRQPVCLIHVKDDWLVGHHHSEALFEKASGPKELHVLEVAGNFHADRIFSQAGEAVEAILRRFLQKVAPVDLEAGSGEPGSS